VWNTIVLQLNLMPFDMQMLLRDMKRNGAWMQSDPNLLKDRSGAKMAGVGECNNLAA
jgi:hypothetical protein